jgi:hypothetical protein
LGFDVQYVYLGILLLGLLGILLLFLGIRRFWRRGIIAGSLEGLSGLVLLLVAVLLVAVSVNLHTYARLTHESPVAEIRFQALGPQNFRAYITLSKSRAMIFNIRGDEWQMDARILKWRGIALLMGLDTVYRLDRISGRYSNIIQELTAVLTVYSLSEDRGIDLWALAQRHSRWIPLADAVYGSATYLPMADGAQYQIAVSVTGLLARPGNEVAKKAIQKWR